MTTYQRKYGLRQRQVLALLKQEGPLQYTEITTKLGLPRMTGVIASTLNSLARDGLVCKAPGLRGAWALAASQQPDVSRVAPPVAPRPPSFWRRVLGIFSHAA